MSRLRFVAGFVAAVMIVMSSAAHSVLGWKQMSAELAAIPAPAELTGQLALGWIWGGVAMLAFGLIVMTELLGALRRRGPLTLAPFLVGLAYAAFGSASIVMTRNPFFVVFVLPGMLLLFAAWPARRAAGT